MKKIIKSTLMLLLGIALFTACADDNDSNPTLQLPTTFKLNTPSYATLTTSLGTSTQLPFTWSQPDYGFPAAVEYQLQVSLDGNFTTSVEEAEADESGATKANYATIDATFKEAKGVLEAEAIDKAMMQIAQWEENSVPSTQDVYVRASATTPGTEAIYSNVVKISTIPYYIELSDSPIDIWYLIGADIADGSWGSDIAKSIIPMQAIEGEEYDKKTGTGKIQWIGYLAGGGFKLKHYPDNWDYQWGQGDSFGSFVENDGGSGNISVPEAGVYKVVLDTKAHQLTVEKYEEAVSVFSGMAISGSFNEWGDTEMTACNPNAENHDWYIVQHLDAGAEIKIKQAGSWDYNKGGAFVTETTGMYAFGVTNGDNLWISETADYMIIFNDITGFIRFIKQ